MLAMKLGWLKWHYVLVYGTLGSLMPYLPVYCRQMGLSPSQIGLVSGVFGVAVLISPPLYTALADRWANNRRLIGLCYAVAAVAVAALAARGTFPAIFAAHLLFSLGFTAMIPMLDGLTFSVLHAPADEGDPAGAVAQKPPYQSIRIFGSVGWMIPGFLLAALVAFHVADLTVSYTAMGLCVACCVLGLATVFALPQRRATKEKASALPTVEALRVFARPPVAAYMTALCALFIASSIYFMFYPLYLDQLGIDTALIGLITNLGVLVELPFMIASAWMIRRFGFKGVMIFGALCVQVRLILMAAWPTPLVAIGTQIFHGPTVVALYLLPPMFINDQADERYRSSIQGLKAVLVFGIARIVGSVWGGRLGETSLGAAFAAASVLAGVAVLVLLFVFRDAKASSPPHRSAG